MRIAQSLFISLAALFVFSYPALAAGDSAIYTGMAIRVSKSCFPDGICYTCSTNNKISLQRGGGKVTVKAYGQDLTYTPCREESGAPITFIFTGDYKITGQGAYEFQINNCNDVPKFTGTGYGRIQEGKVYLDFECNYHDYGSKENWNNVELTKESGGDDEYQSERGNAKVIYEYGPGGGFSDMYGQVEVNTPQADGTYDEEDWHFAKLDGKTLPPGTHIKTFEKSGVIMSFGQNSYILGPESELIIEKNQDQPGQAELLLGNLWTNVKKMMKDGSMEIEMSQAVAGIKGTTFALSEDKNKSTLKVIEGTVSFKSKANDKTETVNAGETITADKNGLGKKTTFDTAAEQATWDAIEREAKKSTPKLNNIIYAGLAVLVVVIIGIVLKLRMKKA